MKRAIAILGTSILAAGPAFAVVTPYDRAIEEAVDSGNPTEGMVEISYVEQEPASPSFTWRDNGVKTETVYDEERRTEANRKGVWSR